MKITLKTDWISRIMLIIKLFLQMFWENLQISFKIMLCHYSQLRKLKFFCFHKVWLSSCCTIHNWNSVSRMGIDSSRLDDLSNSLHTWICIGIVHSSLFQDKGVRLLICFATPCEMTLMFQFVWSVTFDALSSLNPTWKCYMPLFLAVFVLGHTRVHIYPSNGGNVVFYIETSINKALCLASTLNIPNVQLNNGHIWFWGYLDNLWFGC